MNSDFRKQWIMTRDRLVNEVRQLGFPEELGLAVARNLGSPKAMERMIKYLQYVKPNKAELVVDEMLAICSEIEEWRKRKENQEANAKYNVFLQYGFEEMGEDF